MFAFQSADRETYSWIFKFNFGSLIINLLYANMLRIVRIRSYNFNVMRHSQYLSCKKVSIEEKVRPAKIRFYLIHASNMISKEAKLKSTYSFVSKFINTYWDKNRYWNSVLKAVMLQVSKVTLALSIHRNYSKCQKRNANEIKLMVLLLWHHKTFLTYYWVS